MRFLQLDRKSWFVILACLLPFFGFWAYGLTDLDEGFYGAVVVDMLRRGDWITPTYNGVPWFEKPILAYWLAMPTVAVFGNEFGARLPSVLCSFGTIWVLFSFVRRHADLDLARVVAVAYAGCLLPAGLGRMMMTDAPLALCLAIAVTQFFESLDGRLGKRWIAAAAVGFGILAKGPVAAILFFGVIGTLFTIAPGLRPKFRGGWLIGLVICLAVVSTWYVPCYLANGQSFIDRFLIEQNVGRFAGGDKAHGVPFYLHPIYFPVIVFLGALPWTGWSLRTGLWKRGGESENPDFTRLLWAWFWFPLVFFSISGTKLPHYILPSIAPLVILTVRAVVRSHPSRLTADRWLAAAGAWAVVIFALSMPILHKVWDSQTKEVQSMAKFAWQQDKPLVIYEIGREGTDVSLSLDLQQTSHPSILFYYRRPVLMTDKIAEVIAGGETRWMITRAGRLGDEDLANLVLAGWEIRPVVTPFEQQNYRLIEVGPELKNDAL